MNIQKIQKRISNFLAEDEVMERTFYLERLALCATNKRLIEVYGRTIKDYDYTHISSIEYSSRRYWWMLVLGIILFVGGVSIARAISEVNLIAVAVAGLLLVLLFINQKPEDLIVQVVGIPKGVMWRGSKDDLDELLQIIRQKRNSKHEFRVEAPSKANPQAPITEAKDIDSIEKIRQLAKLEDDGIITGEEYQQKKTELLRELH